MDIDQNIECTILAVCECLVFGFMLNVFSIKHYHALISKKLSLFTWFFYLNQSKIIHLGIRIRQLRHKSKYLQFVEDQGFAVLILSLKLFLRQLSLFLCVDLVWS